MDLSGIIVLLTIITIGLAVGTVLIAALPLAALVYVWRHTYPYMVIIGRWAAQLRNFAPLASILGALILFFLIVSILLPFFLIVVIGLLVVLGFPSLLAAAVWTVRLSRKWGPVVREEYWEMVPVIRNKMPFLKKKTEEHTDQENGVKNGNGHANGLKNGNGHANGLKNGNGHANGLKNGNGHANGVKNGNGHANGLKNGNGHANGLKNGNGSEKDNNKPLTIKEKLKKWADTALTKTKAGYTWLSVKAKAGYAWLIVKTKAGYVWLIANVRKLASSILRIFYVK